MHILELPSFFPPYGGMFCVDQSKALAMQGNTVRIAACVNMSARITLDLYMKAPLRSYLTDIDGIEVLRKDLRGIPFFSRPCAMHWVRATGKLVDKYVEKYGKPDIIHAHCCKWAGYVAMKAARKYGVPYVITEHLPLDILSREFGPKGKKAWQVALLREAYERADMVVPVSEEWVDYTADFFGKDYRWRFVSNTINVDFFAYKERKGRKNEKFTMCCIADFIPRKGYDILLSAVRLFIDKYGVDADLLIAGNNTDSDEMKKMVERYGMERNVKLCGRQDKEGVRKVLYDSDCLVLATRSEVQPLVLLEAMSTGIPVVSTEAIPRSERIDGGCFICGIDDAEELTRQMHHVYSLDDFDGKRLSEKISAMASPQVVGEMLDGMFRGIVKGR